MRANNISIADFLNILNTLHARGHKLIDLDMVQDEQNGHLNKLVVHPVSTHNQGLLPPSSTGDESVIRNPNISVDNNDIFDSFDL